MLEILSTEWGKIEVSNGGLLGQVIKATRPNGDTRTIPMIEDRHEYDFEMIRSMVWLGLIAPPSKDYLPE